MMWQPPPPPPQRAVALVQQARQQARRQRQWDEIRGVRVPMARNLPIVHQTNGGAVAQTDGTTLFLDGRPSGQVMSHEAAHVLDTQNMTDADRRRFSMILGRPKKPWETFYKADNGDEMTEHSSTSERFADMVSMLVTQKFPKPGRGGGFPYLDKPPSRHELLRFSRALDRMGRRYNLPRYARPDA